MSNIIFLLSHVPNPRINKRIALAVECSRVTVVCTRRKSQNIWEPAYVGIKHIMLDIDLPSSKHLLKRYLVSKNYQKAALKNLEAQCPDIIYAEGLDSLMIANKYKAAHADVRIFFEVADLRECFIEKPKSILSKITTKIIVSEEKKNFMEVDCLVVTSMKFYDFRYKELINKDKVLYMPNMPDTASFADYKKKTGGKFTVGFIGGIRYLKQMKMLVDAAEKVGCKVLFAGAGGTETEYKEITTYCQGKSFVSFTGKYQYDKDIAGLYGKTDCVYAVYDADNPNVRIALPNKLYEAVLCGLPIIVARDTYLSEIVNNWGVGVAVGHNDQSDLCEVLRKLKSDPAFYNSFVMNCREHKTDICLDEYNIRLRELLQNSESLDALPTENN